MWLRSLTGAECVSVLASQRIAHLACAAANTPYVVPLYYAYADEQIFGFSAPGKKIEIMRINPVISLVVEEPLSEREWRCVVAEGRFEELPERIGYKRERDHAWSLLSKHGNWWEPGALKPAPSVAAAPEIFFRIHITEMSGREARNDSAAT